MWRKVRYPAANLRRPVTPADKAYAFGRQGWQQGIVEDAVLPGDLFVHDFGNPCQCLLWLNAVGIDARA